MYRLCWKIKIGKYLLKTLSSVKISSSVLNLSDTAVITLPGKCLNRWKKIEEKIKVGDEVEIALGYDDNVKIEFKGYLNSVSREGNSLALHCVDALFLLKKTVPNKEYKQVSLKYFLSDILKQVDESISVDCDYDYVMSKMVVFHSTALDVLKKIHEECKANIWFEDKVLHVHPVYSVTKGSKTVIYDTQLNVQSNELKWVDKADKKVQIEVVFNKPDGKQVKEVFGNEGGEKITKYVSGDSKNSMRLAAESEYKLWNYSGFEGTFTGWLIPRTIAGDCVVIRDEDREEGKYYVTGIEIDFGQSGAKRKVTLGRRIG